MAGTRPKFANLTGEDYAPAVVLCDAEGNVIGATHPLPISSASASGAAASGAAVSGNPVLVAGADPTLVRTLLTDTAGNQLVRGAAPAATTGNLTTSSTSIPCAVLGYPTVSVLINGTHNGVSAIIEGSFDGGVSYSAVLALRVYNNVATNVNSYDTATVGLTQNGTYAWQVPSVAGMTHVRVRSTAWTSGSAVVTIQPVAIPSVPSLVTIAGSGGSAIVSGSPADGISAGSGFYNLSQNMMWDGTNWNRWRGQEKTTLLASAGRTSTTSANLTLQNNCGLLLVVDVTARASATTLTPSLVMGQTGFVANKTIWTAAAAINSASGTFMYVFWPFPADGAPTGYTEVVNRSLFREHQVTITHNDANSVTYSVTAYASML